MAYILNNIFPNDQVSRKAIGFDFPLNASNVFNLTYTTVAQIKANLINWFLTNKGERIMNLNFGANLRKRVFEAIESSNTDILKDIIQNDISSQFPLVILFDIQIFNSEDNDAIKVSIYYNIQNFQQTQQINIIL